jgi:MFS family permease
MLWIFEEAFYVCMHVSALQTFLAPNLSSFSLPLPLHDNSVLLQAFVYSFEVNLMYNCLPHIMNVFQATSLTSILPTILQILSAALVPFYTKVSDVFGRAQSLTIAMVFYCVGYIIQGTSNSFLQFALGQISYGIGSTGMLTLTQVLIAGKLFPLHYIAI